MPKWFLKTSASFLANSLRLPLIEEHYDASQCRNKFEIQPKSARRARECFSQLGEYFEQVRQTVQIIMLWLGSYYDLQATPAF